MNFFKVFIFTIISLTQLCAQEVDIQLLKTSEKKQIIQQIRDLAKVSLDEFILNLNKIEKNSQELFLEKNEMCKSVFIIRNTNELGQEVEKKKWLNKKERKKCYLLLVNSKIEIQTEIFEVRRSQLTKLHQSQLKSLEESREAILNELTNQSKKFQ